MINDVTMHWPEMVLGKNWSDTSTMEKSKM